ncbi:hypothetical protein [Xanthomonas hortorum]|uniref:Uncharacterized protein n=1 Tax=Xanthomonas hortorum pv. hederae TaxID=453603 RepID=A0A9X4BT98_9XANT|nr:hypothetical protein [Xanthomonas hortorum]MCE4373258.1 hypothetical protein [Xanthomonas hortorum pv. hederae]MDC8639165.1 hypothetical protein [Xanthomonas hortorum pv. hederae]
MSADIDYLRQSVTRLREVVAAAYAVRAERNAEGAVSIAERIAMASVVEDCETWLAQAQRRLSAAYRERYDLAALGRSMQRSGRATVRAPADGGDRVG